jgi:hypothetical protein
VSDDAPEIETSRFGNENSATLSGPSLCGRLFSPLRFAPEKLPSLFEEPAVSEIADQLEGHSDTLLQLRFTATYDTAQAA